MKEITFEYFEKIDMRTGTILEAERNPDARQPAYVMQIDFGPLGVKISSAQLTENYNPDDLVGRQVIAVTNFPAKRIAGVMSQVLVLGIMSEEKGVVLLQPDRAVKNGDRIG